MEVGIIGLGRIGRLMARYMAKDFDLFVHDKEDRALEIRACGATPCSFAEACQRPIVIPAVPISEFEAVVTQMAGQVPPGCLVVDVCSVKSYPAKIMQEKLPAHVSLLATHPMFGPDSAKDTLFGQKIVLCPLRMPPELYQDIKTYLNSHGLRTIEATPDEHDRQIASSLFLTHFIGRTLMALKAGPHLIDTKGYRRLMKILETVENDTWQLFEDMYRYNPYAPSIRQDLFQALEDVSARLDNGKR